MSVAEGIEAENDVKLRQISHAAVYVGEKSRKIGDKRCPRCWLDSRESCICAALPSVQLNPSWRIIIYMDFKEYLNPGDDAKLLRCACRNSENVHLVLYPFEDYKLAELLPRNLGNTDNVEEMPTTFSDNDPTSCVLFPSEIALSQPDFIENCLHSGVDWWLSRITSSEVNVEPSAATDPYCEAPILDNSLLSGSDVQRGALQRPLTVVVVDAVWRHARKMAKHLREIIPHVSQVQLTPEQLSVYARKQTQPDRICTVEATALFLQQCGENPIECDKLIECVRINNKALKRKK